MKKKAFLLFAILTSTIVFSQKFYFTKKVDYYNGNPKGTSYVGNFSMEFEIGSNGKELFTLYHNNIEQRWFSFIENQGTTSKGNLYFSKDYFFDTQTKDAVTILSTHSKDFVVIFYKNSYTEYVK